jgi:hypothetical protein
MCYTRDELVAMVVGKKYFPQSELGAVQNCQDPDRLTALARDPAHGGELSPKSLHEAVVALELERKGPPAGLKGPVTRDPLPGRGDFIDGDGKVWDVKSPISYIPGTRIKPPKGGFDLNAQMASIGENLDKGESVILDSTDLDPADKAALEGEITNAAANDPLKWTGRIVWYP